MVITAFSILMFFTMFGHNSAIETYAIVFRRQKPSRNDHKIHVSKHVSSKSEKFQMGPRTTGEVLLMPPSEEHVVARA